MRSPVDYLPSRLVSCAPFAIGSVMEMWSGATETSIGAFVQGIGLAMFAWFMFLRPVLLRGSLAPSWAAAAVGTQELRKTLWKAALITFLVGVVIRYILQV
jgi:hypothetical protein